MHTKNSAKLYRRNREKCEKQQELKKIYTNRLTLQTKNYIVVFQSSLLNIIIKQTNTMSKTTTTTQQNGATPHFPEINIRDLSFHEEAKKFVYAWLRSQNTPHYDEAARKYVFFIHCIHSKQ